MTLPRVSIQTEDFDLSREIAALRGDNKGVGAVCSFVGTVRDQTKGKTVVRLEFEAYEPMAILEMEKIGMACKELFNIHKVCIHHRTHRFFTDFFSEFAHILRSQNFIALVVMLQRNGNL